MLLKNHLIEVFKKASSENNILLKENIVLKWVHRFGIDSLNDLSIHASALMGEEDEEENLEQATLMDEEDEQENLEQTTLMDEQSQEQIKLELSNTLENIDETEWESNHLETSITNGIFKKDQNSNNIKELSTTQKLPLPNIKNLRKWINNDKKAS